MVSILTLPEPDGAVVPGGGEQSAGEVPADPPHARVVLLEGRHHLALEPHRRAVVTRRR